MRNKNIDILMELRPALEGFAGIPQETRLIFSMLHGLDGVEVTGLLNHYRIKLSPALKKETQWTSPTNKHKRINKLSRHVVSYVQKPYLSWHEKILNKLESRIYKTELSARARLGLKEKIYAFDSRGFEGFIWSKLFSKTLPASEFKDVTAAKFAILQAPWGVMHKVGLGGGFLKKYPILNTKGYDFFLSQTPMPARLSHGTRLLVRYHDAIPIFLPHTIPDTSLHQATHYWALRDNIKNNAFFVCTSESSRNDLIEIFPSAEKNSCVIHDVVSHNYFHEPVDKAHISTIIRARINHTTEPKFLTSRERLNFYFRNTAPDKLRYIMMVSTLEPRKNHMKLIGAWEKIRQSQGLEDLRLIIVGELGWSYDNILRAMKPWQEQGQLFHLSRVPSANLRALYNGAEAVVCPSLAEGFDLSGIEAMLCGALVVASDIPVHREVYGEHASYFNPYSTMNLAEKLEEVLTMEQKKRKEKVQGAMQWAQRYKKENISLSWKELIFNLI